MRWLRHVIVDLLVTACIVAATVFDQAWAAWVVVVYTPLMLLLMAFAFFAPGLAGALGTDKEVPPIFYHVLYGINVVALALDAQWLVAAGWGALLEITACHSA